MAKKRKHKKKLRPMNEISLDLEKILEEMTDPKGHDMQWGEIRAQVMIWLAIHADHAQEEYTDGKYPVDLYGHPDWVYKKVLDLMKKK